jgi:hypothetical protein
VCGLDGKTVRGAKDAAGNQPHLLAALVGTAAQSSVVAAQAEVVAKTNEVPMAKAVPESPALAPMTPCIKKTNPRPEPGRGQESWLLYLAICALRLFGRTDVTEATRWASRSTDRPFIILGLTS